LLGICLSEGPASRWRVSPPKGSQERVWKVRAAIYARVSTNNGQDPSVQTREMREYCQRRGWEIAGEFVDAGFLLAPRDGWSVRDADALYDRLLTYLATLHTKFTASSVLPDPVYFATSG
jgi:hypothetical protein